MCYNIHLYKIITDCVVDLGFLSLKKIFDYYKSR